MNHAPRKAVSLAILLALLATPSALAEKQLRPDNDPRVTPTVRLVRQCLPALVSVRVERAAKKEGTIEHGHGGGSVIHADGYILTNHHVIDGAKKVEVAFFQGPWQTVRVVASLPAEDLALLKLDSEKPLPALPLGRSHDLELGEPVITLGSAGALPHSLSAGLISGLGRATDTERAHLPSVVQTTAPISGGSSGGALINALGEQIGVIASRKADGDNLGFAITIDRVREVFPHLITGQADAKFVHGLQVDPFAQQTKVTEVQADSPAATSLQKGDVITHVNDMPVHGSIEFLLAMLQRKPDAPLKLKVVRGEPTITVELP